MKIDKSWTLFLDRDGVINERIPGEYISEWDKFTFTKDALGSFKHFDQYFDKIVVVTNQQGISKGVMTLEQLEHVHSKMVQEIEKHGGRIDKVYFCDKLASDNSMYRKPNIGMGLEAKLDFPSIDYSKSIMVGDSISDMVFGEKLGMKTVFVEGKQEELAKSQQLQFDAKISKLADLVGVMKFSQ